MASEVIVSISNLSHSYRPGEWVFQDCNASIKKGEIFAILGPNGRGKTTLLKILLGAIKPTIGNVAVGGTSAFVPQIFQSVFDYRCLDMVLMGRAKKIGMFSKPSRRDEEIALHALARVGIAHYAERSFHELSGGQRQLVIFARAIAAEAEVLVMDEPTSALDLENQEKVLALVHDLSRKDGLTVLMTTHHPHHAYAIADQSLLMHANQAFDVGASKKVLTEDALSRLYKTHIAQVSFHFKGRMVHSFVPVIGIH